MRLKTVLRLLGLALALFGAAGSQAEWRLFPFTPSQAGISTMLLMTDGSVMCFEHVNGLLIDGKPYGIRCWKLVPDDTGSYLNGTFIRLADMHKERLWFASCVLADGRVFVAGGERIRDTREGHDGETVDYYLADAEVYDPVTDTWTEVGKPIGHDGEWDVGGDMPAVVMPDGRVFLGRVARDREWSDEKDDYKFIYDTYQTSYFNPGTNTFSPGGNRAFESPIHEETWVLMHDGSVVAAEGHKHPNAQRFDHGSWKRTSPIAPEFDLTSDVLHWEFGPGFVLPQDRRAFFCGPTGHTALYDISTDAWEPGPKFPLLEGTPEHAQLGANDGPGVILPDGNVLVLLSPNDLQNGGHHGSIYVHMYRPDDNNGVVEPQPDFVSMTADATNCRMLLLPSGEVLLAYPNELWIRDAVTTGWQESWRPTIEFAPSNVSIGGAFELRGRRLVGLSEACSFGDDAQCATNYPILQVTNDASGKISYLRSYQHGKRGITTAGNTTETTTMVAVPNLADLGPSKLRVVVNGIPSNPVDINIGGGAGPRTKLQIKPPKR